MTTKLICDICGKDIPLHAINKYTLKIHNKVATLSDLKAREFEDVCSGCVDAIIQLVTLRAEVKA